MDDENKNIENNDAEDEKYSPNIISVTNDDGKEYTFEELDSFFEGDTEYVALISIPDSNEEILDDDNELIVLIRSYDGDEVYLEPIEDKDEFLRIGNLFENRLSDMFEFDDEE